MSKDPLVTYLSHGDQGLFDLGSMIYEMDSTLDSTSHLESSSWVSTHAPLLPLASSPMPHSFVSLPKPEFKPLPYSLKDVLLGHKETLHSIISLLLSCDQEKELIHVLSSHKGAIGGRLLI